MSGIEPFDILVESTTGNLDLLLHEIRHALLRLSKGRQGTAIDLKSLPLAPGEEDRLLLLLGKGEVYAELMTLGKTVVEETRIPGVWVITHHNIEGAEIAKFIEVTKVPDIILSQREDMLRGIQRLNDQLGIDGRQGDAR